MHRDRGFIIHRPAQDFGSTLRVTEDISVSTSRDILAAIARGDGPPDTLIALGYAGWGAGQLEQEILQNAWLSGPATLDLLFHSPVERRWNDAAALLGIDLTLLSGEVGHAGAHRRRARRWALITAKDGLVSRSVRPSPAPPAR